MLSEDISPRRFRAASFYNTLDEEMQASGVLGNFLQESNVFLGGSSVGKGLKKAAQFYMNERDRKKVREDLPGFAKLQSGVRSFASGASFYVVDIGIIVSQMYQWKLNFPRIEPFYAVKCNPDPVVIKALSVLGCNFDCASREEIRLVQESVKGLREPNILYANPCKAVSHLTEAVCRGVTLMTFDNATEVIKCASVSKHIQLILRIITDDRGSVCRFSTKFGAPRNKWRPLLALAKNHGLEVVGVSFHVGSGCHDASKYELALNDAREIFDMAEREFGFDMKILDIGGGFPGETHSIWNPSQTIDAMKEEEEEVKDKGLVASDGEDDEKLMYFTEIAEVVAPLVDKHFPPHVRVIAEPGRYFVAAACTLCCSVVAMRNNSLDTQFEPRVVEDSKVAKALDAMTRKDEQELISGNKISLDMKQGNILASLEDELAEYTSMFASQQLSQQEFDVYNDNLDLYEEGYDTATDLLGPPKEYQLDVVHHTAEGMVAPIVEAASFDGDSPAAFLALAAAGEAAMSGMVMQAVADTSQLQDEFAYYINDGVYGAFNNLMFDHAHVRPRVLQAATDEEHQVHAVAEDGFKKLEVVEGHHVDDAQRRNLFASTIFGPTCDSIDVISRSVLLPQLNVGDWLYFQNMGAYTMAAASNFNGFDLSEKFYVCSVQPEFFEDILAGPIETDKAS